jgi:hypothetical protein
MMRIITAIAFSLVGYIFAQTAHAEQTNKTAQPPKFDTIDPATFIRESCGIFYA